MALGSYFPVQKKAAFDTSRTIAPDLAPVPGGR